MTAKKEDLEFFEGSGNIFRDFGCPDADREQLRAVLAAHVIKILNRKRLTVHAAEARTGIPAADFSRIRNADLGRFTVERLIAIINRLGFQVDTIVTVSRKKKTRWRKQTLQRPAARVPHGEPQ